MIAAAQAALLVAAEPERYAAMGAELVHQSETALGIPKRNESLRQKLDAHRRAIRLRQLFRQHGRDPIAPEQVAHRRVRPGPGEKVVELAGRHRPGSRVSLLL